MSAFTEAPASGGTSRGLGQSCVLASPDRAVAFDHTDAGYPPHVITLEQMRRWDRCEDLAMAIFGDLDQGEMRAQVWSAIRVYDHSDMPTGDESERTTPG